VALSTAVYTAYVMQTMRAEAEQELKQRAERLAAVLSQALARPLFDINSAAVASVVDASGAAPEVLVLRVLAPNGSELASYVSPHSDPVAAIRVHRDISFSDASRSYPVGAIDLAFSRKQIDQELQRQLFNTMAANLLLALAIVVSIFMVGRKAAQPFADIQLGLEKLTRGETDIELSGLARQDQVGRLSGAVLRFRDTLTRLHAAERELRELNSGLERRVTEHALEAGRVLQAARADQAGLQAVADTLRESLARLEQDLSERREREQKLQAANAMAEAASIAKSEFLINMSREIRAPMNAISDLARQALAGDGPQEAVVRIQRDALALLGIINHVMDYAKIDAGLLELRQSPFVLDEVLAGVAAQAAPRAAEKQLAWIVRVAPEVPRHLVGDALRLEQVLANLAGNAVKFTDRGELELSCSVLETKAGHAGGAGTVRLRFAVRDTGIGMSAPQKARLFRAFSPAADGAPRRPGEGGAGLGLAISQQLVRLMGGKIDVASEPGRGSTFQFNLAFAVLQHEKTPV
jgi:signal transduction histidine kinase